MTSAKKDRKKDSTNAHQLGIPTANIPPDGLATYPDLQTGVYYGVAALDPAGSADEKDVRGVLPAVLSIGFNPYYKNTVRSVVSFLSLSLSLSLCVCVCGR